MALSGGILHATVVHARLAPKKHRLRYRVFYLCLPLAAMARLDALHLFSRERFNLYSLRARDYGHGDGQAFSGYVHDVLRKHNIAASEIVLITQPRILGYVFNPVSFWCCLDEAGQLRAVLAEVNNTFGERHVYLCAHTDGREIAPDAWLTTEKVFHVSPLLAVKGEYRFRFDIRPEHISIAIHHYQDGELLLVTSLAGERRPLSDRALLGCFLRYPLQTLMVIARIHWHALRLVLKGVAYRVKPEPPQDFISR